MSSVGVFEKKSKCFVRKKKSKYPKENFQSVKRGKMFKYRISGVRKKNERKREKKRFWEKMFGWNFAKFVSLVRLYVNLQVKVTEKKKWKFSKYFAVKYLKLRI